MTPIDQCKLFIAGMTCRGIVPVETVTKLTSSVFGMEVTQKAMSDPMFRKELSQNNKPCLVIERPFVGKVHKLLGTKAKKVSDL